MDPDEIARFERFWFALVYPCPDRPGFDLQEFCRFLYRAGRVNNFIGLFKQNIFKFCGR